MKEEGFLGWGFGVLVEKGVSSFDWDLLSIGFV